MEFGYKVQILLYGLYATLVYYCIHSLSERKTRAWKNYLAIVVILFSLSTLQVSLVLLKKLSAPSVEATAIVTDIQYSLYLLTNCIVTGFFIFRSYITWGRKKQIIALPILLLLVTTGLGFSLLGFRRFGTSPTAAIMSSMRPELDVRAFLFLNFVTNVMVSSLIAGRILWTHRKMRAMFGGGFSQCNTTTIAMIVESGSIHCLFIAGALISLAVSVGERFLPNTLLKQVSFAAVIQIVGIVPTLTIHQVSRGNSIEDVNIEDVEAAVSHSSLSRLHLERTTDENSARRSDSPELAVPHVRWDYRD